MNDRERAVQLLNTVPDYKIQYVITYLQGITAGEETLNKDTIAAIEEGDELLENKAGQRSDGSTENFFQNILEE